MALCSTGGKKICFGDYGDCPCDDECEHSKQCEGQQKFLKRLCDLDKEIREREKADARNTEREKVLNELRNTLNYGGVFALVDYIRKLS